MLSPHRNLFPPDPKFWPTVRAEALNCNIYKIKNKDQKRKNGGEWCDVGWNGGHIIKK